MKNLSCDLTCSIFWRSFLVTCRQTLTQNHPCYSRPFFSLFPNSRVVPSDPKLKRRTTFSIKCINMWTYRPPRWSIIYWNVTPFLPGPTGHRSGTRFLFPVSRTRLSFVVHKHLTVTPGPRKSSIVSLRSVIRKVHKRPHHWFGVSPTLWTCTNVSNTFTY